MSVSKMRYFKLSLICGQKEVRFHFCLFIIHTYGSLGCRATHFDSVQFYLKCQFITMLSRDTLHVQKNIYVYINKEKQISEQNPSYVK